MVLLGTALPGSVVDGMMDQLPGQKCHEQCAETLIIINPCEARDSEYILNSKMFKGIIVYRIVIKTRGKEGSISGEEALGNVNKRTPTEYRVIGGPEFKLIT